MPSHAETSMNHQALAALAIAAAGLFAAFRASAQGGPETLQGTAIAYQGELKNNGNLFTGTAEFRFRLYDAATGGVQVGPTVSFEAGNAVAIASGAINLPLDFGSGAFTGQARWLEVDVRTGLGPFNTLSPRQAVGSTPYALYALQSAGVTLPLPYSASFTSPTNDALTMTNLFGGGAGYSGRLGGPGYGVVGKHNVTGNLGYIGHADYGVFGIAESAPDVGVRGHHTASGNYGQLGVSDSGVVGSGNVYGVYGNSPQFAGRFVSPGSGGNGGTGVSASATAATGGIAVLAETASSNGVGVSALHAPSGNIGQLSVSNAGVNGIAANGSSDGVRGLHNPSGNLGQLGTVSYGVKANCPSNALGTAAVYGSTVNSVGQLGTNTFMGSCGVVGAGLAAGGLFIGNQPGSFAASFYVQTNGVICEFNSNSASNPVGSISVSGGTVSYNPFTGSHLAWTDSPIERSTLVQMTGENQRNGAECVYGIAPTGAANSPRCLGAYFDVQQPNSPAGTDNPHLVMAVGNGDMWVAESSAGNIRPGDYLISSDVSGCAMKDDPSRFAVGHIVARAAEEVDWSQIESPVDGSPRRARISVFFESFDRHGDAIALQTHLEQQQREIESQRARIDLLHDEIEALKTMIRAQQ